MISFPPYDSVISKVYQNNQEHVFTFWNSISDIEKKNLCDDLSSVDFNELKQMYIASASQRAENKDYSPAPYIQVCRDFSSQKAYDAGAAYVRHGKLAAFLVAGGQGSRLGYDGPKGAFQVSPVKNKTLFQIHSEKILKYNEKYGVRIPFLIMTSEANHTETLEHFEANNCFGLDKNDLIVFTQNMIPSITAKGKLILSSPSTLFKNPDGHGGSLTALRSSGALDELRKRGVDTISYFQVDNPAVNIIDPCFIGYHILNRCEVSSKIVEKTDPGEKVGLFVRFADGTDGVVEYSDMPQEKITEKTSAGTLAYSAANLAIHLFDLSFIERLTSGADISLPYHTAKKKIKTVDQSGTTEIDGFKFEKFVFDAIPLAKNSLIIETIREEEFAPVKNASGADSLATSRTLMSNLHRSWLNTQGVKIPPSVKIIEISPLTAVEPADLPNGIHIPDEEKVYL